MLNVEIVRLYIIEGKRLFMVIDSRFRGKRYMFSCEQ